MLTSDIGNFFGSMTTIYGHLWSHGADEIDTWRRAMIANKVTPRDLQMVSNRCLKDYANRPPTMGQVIGLVEAERKSWPGTMLGQQQLSPPKQTPQMCHANRIMFSMLVRARGVRNDTLKIMLEAKNAAVEDYERLDQDEVEFAAEFDTMLSGLIKGHENREL